MSVIASCLHFPLVCFLNPVILVATVSPALPFPLLFRLGLLKHCADLGQAIPYALDANVSPWFEHGCGWFSAVLSLLKMWKEAWETEKMGRL
jgi:hypothetical protein